MLVVVDTGPLYAAADLDDAEHDACLAALEAEDHELLIPALVVAEASYLIGTRLGPSAEATFLRSLEAFGVEAPEVEDWARIAQFVERYENFPLGGTDASIVVLAERHGARTLVTLDRRHFGAVRPRHCRSFRLLP